ncbi:winged helix-turn-helix transcriptional regulator [Haploplasma axanthum]|uniref:Uncharacterized HTH-type transcriptional regulator ytcD n=1 Tax=Haploplasma axanthum TaxID=29552 RepID=A0A449BEG3_HAPAX|nr:helix-turn-helix domain-containing protein [Haploplasma axanthum]VEU80841.1 Uncharacterized HTH-type transcriptional regulator ytcD [Haploplasma axanthum]
MKKTNCEVNDALSIISGKWKPAILFTLISNGSKRFNELERLINGITPRMLAKELKELENNQIVKRTQYETIPLKVTYEMTEYGMSLKDILIKLHEWGINHNRLYK